MRTLTLLSVFLLFSALNACSILMPASQRAEVRSLDPGVFTEYRSGPDLSLDGGRILTDNDDAFQTKLDLIKKASKTIDLAYYIFADDYSSSLIATELINATKRGVNVRMLLDYHSHYQALDFFNMLEEYGNRDAGSLSVRLYNRPSRNIIKDAVYMTLGCGPDTANSKTGCAAEKFNEIEQLFVSESESTELSDDNNVSNVNTGKSGLFLSGLYAKNPELMAMAVSSGQNIDVASLKSGAGETNEEDTESLKELARLYWLANYGSGMDRLINRIKLSAAFLFYGEQVDPIYDTFSAFLPVERSSQSALTDAQLQRARNDWQYLTDFLHHKLLLVDNKDIVLGGRNVQDAYHMNSNPLSAKYTFMDTDVHLQLVSAETGITDSFEKLWNFETMVASLRDIQRHAPNDFLVHSAAAKQACASLEDGIASSHRACLDNAMLEQAQVPAEERYRVLFNQMNNRAARYVSEYQPVAPDSRSPSFNLDATALAGYVENLPFDKNLPASEFQRLYGADNDNEMGSGKNIHALWLSALKKSCESASPENPVTVFWHNAYLFLPSNLLSGIAQMVDGRQPCANVDVIILSNSIETTDLNVVNVLSRHSMKALFEHYASEHDPASGATLQFFEYIPQADTGNRSLHSKVMIFAEDIFIGSANADLRSYMMDTNNGVFIRQAPELLEEYSTWLQAIIDDESVTAMQNDYYLTTERSLILDAGDKLVDAELAKYRATRFIDDPQQVIELKNRLRKASDEVYDLSKKIISNHHGSYREQALFNSLFKAI